MSSRTTDTSGDFDDDSPADHDQPQERPDPGLALSDLIRAEVLPRLLLAHAASTHDPGGATVESADPTAAMDQIIGTLAERAAAQNLNGAIEIVDTALASGASIDSTLLDLVAPAARRLGDEWLADQRSFADVTLGLAIIQRVVSMLRHRIRPPNPEHGVVVLGAAPNEQHRLGLQILSDLMRLGGWDTRYMPDASMEELSAVVSTEPVVMLGLTVSSDELVAPLAKWIPKIRSRTLNRDLAITVGGAIDLTEFAERAGVKACCDPREVMTWLQREAAISL